MQARCVRGICSICLRAMRPRWREWSEEALPRTKPQGHRQADASAPFFAGQMGAEDCLPKPRKPGAWRPTAA